MKKLYSSEFTSLILQFFKRICLSYSMKISFLVFLYCFIVFITTASAQSLSPGDIAVVRMNQSGTDGFSIVNLVPLNNGVSFYITEQGWRGSTAKWANNAETHILFTASEYYPAGTIFHFDEDDASILSLRINNETPVVSTYTASGFNYAGGDQVIVYQGSLSNPSFITGFTNDNGGSLDTYGFGNDPITRWATEADVGDIGRLDGANLSRIPTGLTNGQNAISIFYQGESEVTNSRYNGILQGTKAQMITAIFDRSKWVSSNSDITRSAVGNTSGSLTITGTNTAPVLTSAGNITYTEGEAAKLLLNNLGTVTDADGDAITEATVTIGGAVSGDVLNAISPAPFTASYDAGTKKLTLSGSGTAAQMQAALNSITYQNTSENPTLSGTANTRLISTTVKDSKNAVSNAIITGVIVSGVNDAPVNTLPGTQTTAEDVTKIFNTANGNLISINDVDVGAGNLEMTLTAVNGTITLSTTTGLVFSIGDGTTDATMTFQGTLTDVNSALSGLVFIPLANYSGNASITVATNDIGNSGSGGAKSDSDVISITITAVNDAPVNTLPGTQTTAEDIQKIFSTANGNLISINDVDAGAANLEITLTAVNGTITLSRTTGLTFSTGDGTTDATMTFQGTLTNINAALNGLGFIPTANYFGNANITITSRDIGNSGAGGAKSDSDAISITVTAVNDLPTAANDLLTVNEDAAATVVNVLTNDSSSPDVGETLAVTAVTQPANGTVTLTGGVVRFTPAVNFNGITSFTYTISDGNGGTATGTVNVTVTAVNDAPTIINDVLTVNEDAAVTAVNVLINDSSSPDVGETLAVTAVTQSANGTVTLTGGVVRFTPAVNFNGITSFTYTISDGNGGTATGTVNVTVTAVNDAPTVTNDVLTVNEDAAATVVNVLTNDSSSPDVGETLTVTAVTQPANGTVTLTGGVVRFTPAVNFKGTTSFTYTISDGNGGTATGTVNVTVTPSVLPVKLITFAARAIGRLAKLEWSTASEKENQVFEIERSSDGTIFTRIGYVRGNGTTASKQHYYFDDRSPLSGTNYYRLIQLDNDGERNELGIKPVSFNLEQETGLTVYPNPASNLITISFGIGTTKLELVDLTGKVVLSASVNSKQSSLELNIQELPSATYFIRTFGPKKFSTAKLIKR
ncbi:MAG: tandem-95 repeat protein [Flavobacteriales bacterium]|nr:MAG: tandem-95 repeat protein [Flavobacteriales bacterium]